MKKKGGSLVLSIALNLNLIFPLLSTAAAPLQSDRSSTGTPAPACSLAGTPYVKVSDRLNPFSGVVTRTSSRAKLDVTTRARLNYSYGKTPLSFEANQGQADGQVKLMSRGRGYTLFLTSTEAVLVLINSQGGGRSGKSANAAGLAETPTIEGLLNSPKSQIGRPEATVLRMKLVGANMQPHVAGLEELPGKVNYFLGNDPKRWRTNVPTYARVEYRDVYPGVNLVYYGNQRQLEYDFVVAPGADPRAIKLAFEGVQRLRTDAQGDLILQTATGDLRMHKPLVYQQVGGVKEAISAAYVLLSPPSSSLSTHRVGFQVASYDSSKPLVIDPVLSYSTYLGGSAADTFDAIAVDTSGHAYVSGQSSSTDFPTTAGAFQTSLASPPDAIVTKFSATGSALVYSTYLGGSGVDFGQGVAVDCAGNAYVAGATTSTDFPTVYPLQAAIGGGRDAFVAKLNAAGSALVYSTYLGGNGGGEEHGTDIAVDSSGNAYVTGFTDSTNFPTVNAFQSAYGGGARDAFVAKLNAAASALFYSSYLGGSSDDRGFRIAVDSSDNAYVSGLTSSTNFPMTTGAFQAAYGGGVSDAFVTKIDPSKAGAASLLYSTYLGGSGGDLAYYGLAVDSSGNAYATGCTSSTNFPTTMGAFQTAYGGGGGDGDAFVTKIDPSQAGAASLLYSTYLGGSASDCGHGIAVDSSGNAYVTGLTYSTDFPTVSPLQPATGTQDVFVAKLNDTGSALVYSTTFGGSGDDFGLAIAVDASSTAYVAGRSTSSNFPTVSPFQSTHGGGTYDAFVAKLVESPSPILTANPMTLQFGDVIVNTTKDLTFTVTNTGGSMLTGGVSTAAPFGVVSGGSFSLGAGQNQIVTVRFSPASTGTFLGSTSVSSNGGAATVSLSGSGIPLEVTIDIKPGSFPNSINLGSGGTVPVAIFSTTDFDATTVNPTTVTLASAPVKLKGQGTAMASFTDVNGDGLVDLVTHVSTEALQLSETDTTAVLEGKTFDGTPIRGVDSVRVVP